MPSLPPVGLSLLRLSRPRNPQNNLSEQQLTQKAKMMMQVKETARIGFKSFLLRATMVVASGFAIGVVAQENQRQGTQGQKSVRKKKPAAGGRGPFRKYEPPPPQVKRMAGQSPI